MRKGNFLAYEFKTCEDNKVFIGRSIRQFIPIQDIIDSINNQHKKEVRTWQQ